MKYTHVMTLIFLPAICFGQMYKWTDPNGVVHYTDRQPDESIRQDALPDHLKILGNRKKEIEEDTQAAYTAFTFIKPEADATVRNDNGTVNISLQVDPPLTESHFLQIYLDGLEVGEKTKSTALTLQNVKKGIHRLQAQIVDVSGQQVMQTEEVSFQYREAADLSKIAPNLVPKPAE